MDSFKLWIARDKDGMLTVFSEKPILKDNEYWAAPYNGTAEMDIVDSQYYYPQITFENSPQRLEILRFTEDTFELCDGIPTFDNTMKINICNE